MKDEHRKEEHLKTLINGQAVDTVSIRDRGFQYGDGVFETIAVAKARPLLWERHIRRLLHGCQRLGFARQPDAGILLNEVERLCQGAERAVLKIIVTRGQSDRGYGLHGISEPTRVVMLSAWPDYPEANAVSGVTARFCRTKLSRNPQLAGLKHLNRLEQVIARAEWDTEYAEGLMCDEDGHVIDGTMSNIFLAYQGAILTPDLSESGVAGVMRELVMERSHVLGIPITIAKITQPQLAEVDELFLTNSLIGIWPIRSLETQRYKVGEITRTLQKAIST